MDRQPASLLLLAVALAAAIAGCQRNDNGDAGAAAPVSDTAPPPVDPAVAGAPDGALPAAATTADAPPADPTATHFRLLDADGNGRITPAEHEQGAGAMFRTMDANADGAVTAAEMDAAQGALGADARMASADKIKVIDTDGDGQLSAEEHAKGSGTMFATMDTNADGALDAGEVRAGHARAMVGNR